MTGTHGLRQVGAIAQTVIDMIDNTHAKRPGAALNSTRQGLGDDVLPPLTDYTSWRHGIDPSGAGYSACDRATRQDTGESAAACRVEARAHATRLVGLSAPTSDKQRAHKS